jgi:hypothetical protein
VPNPTADRVVVGAKNLSPLPGEAGARSRRQAEQGTKLAAGEYAIVTRMNEGGVGPFNPMIYDFRESWTLRTGENGGFEVAGEREYESPRYEPRRERFDVRLARDWRLEKIVEYAKLRWRPDSGPLVCDFQVAALHCTSNAKKPADAVILDLTFERPFGFLWPISAFSLASIAKAVERTPGEVTPVQLITIEEPGPSKPIYPLVLDGRVRYLGTVAAEVAGKKWKANQYELEAPFHPIFRILTAPEGFLLDLAVVGPPGKGPNAEMKLVRYQQFASPPTPKRP